MKIRRIGHEVDLTELPLDGTDMFLLTRIEGTVSLTDLLAVSGCEQVDTMHRIERLASFGLLQTEGYSLEPPAQSSDDILDDGTGEVATATMALPNVRRSARPIR